MFGRKIDRVYGIDYNSYLCARIGNPIKLQLGENTLLFTTESEMLKVLEKLKADHTVGEIKPFVSTINREEYKI